MRLFCASALVAIVLALSASGEHPNVAPGFHADKVYQFNGVDSVNLYNGNVALRISIGQQYGGNGALSYGLGLSYNSKAWSHEMPTFQAGCVGNGYPYDSPNCFKPYVKAVPSRRSNAGMGWLVSLGRLLAPGDPLVSGGAMPGPAGWTYESPDGADHVFLMTDPASSTFQYTRDGSHLRLRHLSNGKHEVDFPDGMVHVFGDYGTHSPRLEAIRDPFGNRLLVEYAASGDWTLKEYAAGGSVPIRQHFVRFVDLTVPNPPLHAPPNYNFAVSEIDLAAFNGQRAAYSFHYTMDTIPYQCSGDVRAGETPDPTVPRLQRVDLPDQSSWEFEYHTVACSSIRSMTLPTKGKVEWTYAPWEMPTTKCRGDLVPDMPDPSGTPFQSSEGVSTKTVTLPGAAPATWTYVQAPELLSGYLQVCSNNNGVPLTGRKHQQSRVTVQAPDGAKSEHFFSVWPYIRWPGISDFSDSEYGLSYTRAEGANGGACNYLDPTALCLSSRQYAPGNAMVRSTYVRYEGETRQVQEWDEQYRREAESRTVFHDDEGRYVQSRRSDYDGLGHYRKTTTWSSCASGTCAANDPWSRKTVQQTNFNPGKPVVTIDPVSWANLPTNLSNRPGTSQKWFLSLFDGTSTKEGEETVSSEYLFDPATTFLKRVRTLRALDGTRSGNDLVVEYLPDSGGLGNVESESYYGGDHHTVGVGALSALSLSNPVYQLTHTYQHGRRSGSSYRNGAATFLTLFGATIDQNTGLVQSSLDTADRQTLYDYDISGRLLSVAPVGMASVTYGYAPATSTASAKITERSLSQTGAVLKTNAFDYDGLGRVFRSWSSNPDGTTSRRETTYDVLGRTHTTSELGTATLLPVTTYENYDSFGRVGRVTAPDNSVSRLEYVGSRQTKRYVSGSTMPEKLRSTEIYDGLGRLRSVIERPDVSGDVVTNYGYDVAGHLRSVQMKSPAGAIQDRTFDYDGRGLLRWESQPESGMSAYTYDARGHVVSKEKSAAHSQFDLRYTYDRAERVTKVEGRNPFYESNPGGQTEFRVIKAFQYATANVASDYRKGKLEYAHRYNYDAWDENGPVYRIGDFYSYQDAAGRRTGRTTSIVRIDNGSPTELKELNMAVTYDDLGLPATIHYPMCLDCGGPPVDPLRSSMTYAYSQGRLTSIKGVTSINGVADPVTYWPNGMRKVLPHVNGVADTQTVADMARPTQISFGQYERCVAPTIQIQPAGSTVPSGGGSTTLSVSLYSGGTGPFEFEWWNETDNVGAGFTQSITVTVSHPTTYWVTVKNACGFIQSGSATVTVGSCSAPTTGPLSAVLQPDRSFILRPDPVARAGRTFKWKRLSDGVEWTTETLAVPPPTVAITYSFTVTDDCGSHSSSITLQPAMVITSTALVATTLSTTQITVQWPAVSGATTYTVERRSGPEWAYLGSTSSTTYTDSTVTPSKTYAYRVSASGGGRVSGYSNSDVATTRSFTQAVPNTNVTAGVTNQMLEAVNSVRAAAGWPAVSWSNILAASDPVPNPGAVVLTRHITSSRSRMNEALQSLGVPVASYPDPDLAGIPIRASHINTLLARAQ